MFDSACSKSSGNEAGACLVQVLLPLLRGTVEAKDGALTSLIMAS